MTFSELFLSPAGRLDRRAFVGPAAMLFGAGLLVMLAQPLVILGTAALFGYPSYCLYAKRLRDLGAAPGVTLLAMLAAFLATAGLEVGAMATGRAGRGLELVDGLVVGAIALGVPSLIWLLFTVALMVWPGRR